ncbi:MAG: magnesium/cobalt transporter CorA [Thaumarchaeota archaeon]|nr:magnesium/cobalt transporter CorA [Nitrososphaerota archaeon]
MNKITGTVLNRLTMGFAFATIYQFVVAVATSIISLPLTGNIQDLISGFETIDSSQGFLFITWWIISTILITSIALFILRYKKYLSPYKKEQGIETPTKITLFSAIIIGAIISFLFFLIDIVIGYVEVDTTDVQAIYQAALLGDLKPLAVSIIFSIIAGFAVIGVASRASKVKKITRDIGIGEIGRMITKTTKEDTVTTADISGLAAEDLVHVGRKRVDKITFSVTSYTQDSFNEIKNTTDIQKCLNITESGVNWISISGVHDPDVIKKIGQHFKLHPLMQADIMNTELRPMLDATNPEHIFMILKVPRVDNNTGKITSEQISILLGKNYVLSFQETEDDMFESIRNRIRKGTGEIRKKKNDYLAYALADAVVDSFFVVLEKVGEQTEEIEEELMSKPVPKTLELIHSMKRQMISLRKIIWPMREVIDSFERAAPSQLIEKATKQYIRDVYSHTVQIMDTIESLRDMVSGMLDTYLSSVGNKMNEVMKTLTIIASIFIPISFITGIYGTNFAYIPGQDWNSGFFIMAGIMTTIALVMVGWFKKKAWM